MACSITRRSSASSFAILLLVLWGTVAGRQVAFALLALGGGRRLMLCSEALRPIRTAADGQNLHSQLIAAYAAMTPDELVIEAADLGLPGNATAREAADAAFGLADGAVPPPRPPPSSRAAAERHRAHPAMRVGVRPHDSPPA